MDKNTVMKELAGLIKQGELTKDEILTTYHRCVQSDKQETLNKQSRISHILYYIGGAIVFLGICIFVGTNWSSLNDMTKILATLGSSIMMYSAGTLLSKNENLKKVSDAFYFIASLVAPVGIFVTMDITGFNTDSAGSHSIVAAIVLFVTLAFHYIERRQVFFVFSVIFGTWLFFGLTTFLIGGRPFQNWDFIRYRWLAAGLSHMILGYSLINTPRKSLIRYLYGFGVIEFLTAALCLGGWSPNQSAVWELLFPGLAFGIIFLSVHLKARSFLIFGSLYLVIYILKITNEYFTSGFGWSLSLIVLGFALIGIGYFAYYLNKKYLS